MRPRNPELSLDEDIRRTDEQLHIYKGLVAAFAEPAVLLEVLLQSEDTDEAQDRLRERSGLDAIQARAVLDMQFRRATKLEQTRIIHERDALSEQLQYLKGLRSGL